LDDDPIEGVAAPMDGAGVGGGFDGATGLGAGALGTPTGLPSTLTPSNLNKKKHNFIHGLSFLEQSKRT